MAAEPKFSAGARYERKTILAWVRRNPGKSAEAYLVTRQQRYSVKPGGLGKKGLK